MLLESIHVPASCEYGIQDDRHAEPHWILQRVRNGKHELLWPSVVGVDSFSGRINILERLHFQWLGL